MRNFCSFLTFLLIFGSLLLLSLVLLVVVVKDLGRAVHSANKLCFSSHWEVDAAAVFAVSIAAWIICW